MGFDFNRVLDGAEEKGEKGDLNIIKVETENPAAVVLPGGVEVLSLRYKAELDHIKAEAKAIEVKDEESAKAALNLAARAKRAIKACKEERVILEKDARDFLARVKGAVEPFLDAFKEVEDIITDQKLKPYETRRELERRKKEQAENAARDLLQKKINEEAKNFGIEAPTLPMSVTPKAKKNIRDESGATGYKATLWLFEVQKPDEVLDPYLKIDEVRAEEMILELPRKVKRPDEAKIRKAVAKGVREIQGVRIFEDIDIRVRT
jgi:hypothetical protein